MGKKVIYTLLSFFIAVQLSWGEIPKTISYQGLLTDETGEPLTGIFEIKFMLYETATDGTSFWDETHTLPVNAGIFNAILGNLNGNELDFPFDKQYWLGISIDQNAELSPRIALTAVPYSLSVADSAVTGKSVAKNQVVRSINSLTDDVNLAAGANVTITQSNDTLYISSVGGAAGSGGVSGSGTPGQVAFWIGDSTIAGEDDLYWDTVNKRLGIGATNPLDKLTIDGNILFSKGGPRFIKVEGSTETGDSLVIEAGSKGGDLVLNAGDGSFSGGNIWIDGGDGLDAGDVVISGGKAGVGVAGDVQIWGHNIQLQSGVDDPGDVIISTLTSEVPGDVLINGRNIKLQSFYDTGGNAGKVGGDVIITSLDSINPHDVLISGRNIKLETTSGVLFSGGNVGIGTGPEPTEKLQVAGNVKVSGKYVSEGTVGRTLEMRSSNAQFIEATNDLYVDYGTVFEGASMHFNEKGTERMRIQSGGNVGIGTNTPQEKLHVVGNILATGSITPGSSREYKESISDLSLPEAMAAFGDLAPVKFIYKSDKNNDLHVGFIAEEVPDLLASPKRKGVNTMDVVAVLTKVLQEQQKRINVLEEKIKIFMEER